MKKKILQYFLTAAAVLCCTICTAVSVFAARTLEDTIPNCKLYDVDNFLPAEDQDQINDMIRQVSNDIDMYVGMLIYDPDTLEPDTSSTIIDDFIRLDD